MTGILGEIMVVLLWWLQWLPGPGRQTRSGQGKSTNVSFHDCQWWHIWFCYISINWCVHFWVTKSRPILTPPNRSPQWASSVYLSKSWNSIWNPLPPLFSEVGGLRPTIRHIIQTCLFSSIPRALLILTGQSLSNCWVGSNVFKANFCHILFAHIWLLNYCSMCLNSQFPDCTDVSWERSHTLTDLKTYQKFK